MSIRKSISYHTRLDTDSSVKVVGGSFGGAIDLDTVERLVKAHFTVQVRPSGRPVFVDNQQRPVSLYLRVDPASTAIGKLTLRKWTDERAAAAERLEAEEEQRRAELEEAMSGLSHQEVLRRLKNCN